MFTTGSKYFLGFTGLSLVGVVLYALFINPQDLGAVALLGLLVSFSTLAGFTLFVRDGDTASVEEAVEAAVPVPAPSMWPMVFALGVALLLVGLATVPVVFILGLAVMAAGGVEWSIQNWAERASADSAFNDMVRHRVIGGLEYPGVAALVAGVVVYFFSRIMLATSKGGAAVIFIVVAAVVLFFGFLFSFKPGLRGRVTGLVVTLGVTALVASGVASALAGERAELAEASAGKHFSAEHRECGAEKAEFFDKHANNSVALKSAVVATVSVKDGKVTARAIGVPKDVDTITIPRSNATSILFRNFDSTEHRMVINLGEAKVAETGVVEKVEDCTQLTGKGQENILTVTIPKPSTGDPYSIAVPGASGEIKVVVP